MIIIIHISGILMMLPSGMPCLPDGDDDDVPTMTVPEKHFDKLAPSPKALLALLKKRYEPFSTR